MAFVLKDRVRETSTTTGTGNFTLLGAVTGFQPFSVIGGANDFYYTIAMGAEWEVGIGIWNTSNQLERTTILASSNSNARVNFSAGTKDVFATFPAEGFAIPPPIGGTTPNTIQGTTITATDLVGGLPASYVINDAQNTGVTVTFGVDQGSYSPYISATDGTYNYPLQLNDGVTFPAGVNLDVGGGNALVLRNSTNSTVSLYAPTGFWINYNLYLPTSAGSNNQVLKTDGSGNLSWTTPTSGTVTSVGGTGTVNGLTLTGTVTGSGNLTLGGTLDLSAPPAIGATTPSTGKFTTVQSTVATGTAPFTVASTTNVANLNASSLNGATFAAPGSIGSTTAGSGAFTTITASSNATLTAISDPSAPSNGNLAVYAKTFGGYPTLAARNALNASFGLQSALWSKNVQMWTCTNSTGGSWLNSAGNSAGTFTAVTPTAGSTLYQTVRRSTYANVVTTTNQVLGVNGLYLSFFRGSVAGQGGFFFYTRCGFDVWTNGGRFFAGLALNNTTIVNTDPSGNNNTVGFCVDAADNGAISFLTRGTAATKASTGYTITSNKGYDLYIYCAPNSSQYTWQIVDINAGTSASGTATLNLPTNTQTQQPTVLASNAALTTATAISLGIAKIYCESDY